MWLPENKFRNRKIKRWRRRYQADTLVVDSGQLAGFAPRVRRPLFKARVGTLKHKPDRIRRAVSLLGDDQVGLSAFFHAHFAGFSEEVWAMNEHHHVSVLFDGARFAQVGKARLTVFAFRGARKL